MLNWGRLRLRRSWPPIVNFVFTVVCRLPRPDFRPFVVTLGLHKPRFLIEYAAGAAFSWGGLFGVSIDRCCGGIDDSQGVKAFQGGIQYDVAERVLVEVKAGNAFLIKFDSVGIEGLL